MEGRLEEDQEEQSTAVLGTLILRTSFLTSFLRQRQLQQQLSASPGTGGPAEDNLGPPALGSALLPPPPTLSAEQMLLEEQGGERQPWAPALRSPSKGKIEHPVSGTKRDGALPVRQKRTPEGRSC